MMIQAHNKTRITEPSDIAQIMQSILKTYDYVDQDKEHFFACLLDTRNKIVGIDLISIGCDDASIAQPKEVFRRAILQNAKKIILAHNHPSGETEPSFADITITERLQQAGDILNISVIDHIIFTSKTHISMKEEGKMSVKQL